MTSAATFMTEFHSSMTFEYKAAMDGPQGDGLPKMPSQLHHHNHHPHQDQGMLNEQKSMDNVDRSDVHQSPCSSRGTSLASSPAAESGTISSNGLNHGFSMREAAMGYPSSDDSGSIPNDISGYSGDQDEMPSPLAQLQCALEKNGMIGKKLDLPPYTGVDSDMMPRPPENAQNASDDGMEVYKCHLCSYSSSSKPHFNSHMNSHFDHKCPFCDYTSRTEGRLKRHVKDFHSETPPESWAGSRMPRSDSGGELSMEDSVSSTGLNKCRTYRCKQCGFVAYKKNDFWEHNKIHIKAEKLLTCPQCAFVTEYKHHLEYHIRNHFGSKPFKCGKCNYSCVNKSMLNSHMKSHSNIYQYRCANCSYATKYCHSLKLHLRKYDHKPASVLNVDGSPNPFPVIDVYGSRRGPRPKKRKFLDEREGGVVSATALVSAQSSMNFSGMSPLIPSSLPMMYPPQIFNGYHGSIFIRPQSNGETIHSQNTHFGMKSNSHLKCLFCDFTTDHQEMFHKHMILHAAKENQDLIKLYGISSETIMQAQEQHGIMNNYPQNNGPFRENGVLKTESKGGSCAKRKDESQVPVVEIADNSGDDEPVVKKEGTERSSCSRSDTAIAACRSGTEDSCGSMQGSGTCPQEAPREDNPSQPSGDDVASGRSVIVARKTPPAMPTVSPESDTKVKTERRATAETAPLDLSSAKGNGSLSPSSVAEQEDVSNSSAENSTVPHDFKMDSSQLCPASTSTPLMNALQTQSRNRRKGKAFKIDRYFQLEDHTSPLLTAVEQKGEQRKQEDTKDTIVSLTKVTRSLDSGVQNSFQKPSGISPVTTDQGDGSNVINVSSSQRSSCNDVGKATPSDSSARDMRDQPQQTSTSSDANRNCTFSSSNTGLSEQAREPPLSATADGLKSGGSCPSPLSMPTELISSSPRPKLAEDVVEDAEWRDAYMCAYCDMAFRDCVMYTMHMGYHGYADPFTCNMCGHECKNRVEFFLHIARTAHK